MALQLPHGRAAHGVRTSHFSEGSGETGIPAGYRRALVSVPVSRKQNLTCAQPASGGSTQPGKRHPDVLSEFDNRIILRVNERRSLKVLEETYGGFRGRYDGALTFEQGEALIEGALLCDEDPPPAVPRGVQFKKSRSKEGGGGTPKPDWALPKA